MKKIIFTILFLLPLYHSAAQIDETIKYYKNKGQFYYNSPNIVLQCARFEPAAPCIIKKVTVLLTGGTGTCRLRLFGYEAGDQIPTLQNDIIPPIHLVKTNQGNQSIEKILPDSVKFDNSWFWICIDSLPTGMILLTDSAKVDSIPYSTYYYQAIRTSNADPTLGWSVGISSFYISVLVSYTTKTSPRYLQEVTNECGIMPEAISSCIAAADYNNDGFEDLLVNNKLYRNNKDGTFTDVTQELGIVNNHNPNYPGTAQCYSFVDIDNDGDMDIVIFGYDTSMVFINDNGKFTGKILSLPPFHTFTYSPLLFNWADLNNDGYPDLVALQQASKYDAQTGPDILPSYVFINNKNDDFTDESFRMFPSDHTFRRARASQFGDYNNDGYLDLYIANYYLERDELYQNDGTGNFHDVAPEKNLDINSLGGSQHGSGVNLFDYNNDGNLDLIVARIAHARFVQQYDHRGTGLYRNEGPPDYNFTDLTGQYNNYPGQIAPCGLEYEDYHSSVAFADVNNDGLPDLLLKTYNPYRFISFYEQQPDHNFQMKRFEYGLDRMDCYGAGQVWFDYNNDGKLDLAIYNQNRVSIFRNTIHNGLNAVEIDLRCVTGNKFAIGGRAYVHSGSSMFMRDVVCGQDESVQFPYRLHFGLGNIVNIDSVVVLWPTKPQKREVFRNLVANKIYTLTEGGGVNSQPTGVQLPLAYNMSMKAYPNPFTDYSIISYSVPERAKVILKIFDSEGNEIRTLVNEVQEPGDYQAKFNASGLASGSYFYNLHIGSQTNAKMLILVK
jgi:hypothetical protein